MATLELRPYQKEALVSLWEAARRARKQNEESGGKAPAIRAACVQPTAAGKTVEILCLVRELAARWTRGSRVNRAYTRRCRRGVGFRGSCLRWTSGPR